MLILRKKVFFRAVFPNSFCRYPGFHEQQAPHNLKPEFWVILSARLAFVLVFVVTVTSLKMLVMYIIPDVPKGKLCSVKQLEPSSH